MTSKNDTPTDPGAMTVGELRTALQDRHGQAIADTDRALKTVTVAAARSEVAVKMERAAVRLQTAARLVDRDPGAVRGILDPDDPIKSSHAALVELIQLYGVAELLAGQGARRVRHGE
ncbi:hypothetical protein [Corynebacterium glyciniphilum]|uniref:hypothetical protein n=1 Tax=Corynebacterium glyciniphilum TaxID=1404244 RepID=UPI003FD258E7